MMLREIITPQTQDYTVKIPLEYLNTTVEILVLPFSEHSANSQLPRKEVNDVRQLLKRYPVGDRSSAEIDAQIKILRDEWK
jgi:hypothetical protein